MTTPARRPYRSNICREMGTKQSYYSTMHSTAQSKQLNVEIMAGDAGFAGNNHYTVRTQAAGKKKGT